MSAAEPATPPTPPTLNAGEDAAVIPINARRTRRRSPKPPGGTASMDTPPEGNPPRQSQPDSERQAVLRMVAEQMEKAFNAAGRTLSDDETAYVYRHTLGLVAHTLEGATVSGIISEGQRDELTALISGMREAPQHV